MINRRSFITSISAAAATSQLGACTVATLQASRLRSDPAKILDLPEGYSYRVVSRVGQPMSDGLRVPGYHDGMAAFPAEGGRIALITNHELSPQQARVGAFGDQFSGLDESLRSNLYDEGAGITPGLGGTTTTIYDPVSGRTERQFLSLAGTETNCAGGPTPWGSWLSCEECFEAPGQTRVDNVTITREKKHGYVFEVPASARSMVQAKPIKAMGRFEHEAAAVDAKTGIVYMTEDRHHSLFYRYLPNRPGHLAEGGRLQALSLGDGRGVMTHNWLGARMVVGGRRDAHWIDLDNVDSDKNDLRLRGVAHGAATFARGEGLCKTEGGVAFTCTIGGYARLGQVFHYTPGPYEGSDVDTERQYPGKLTLVAEATSTSILRNADNIVAAPWGDLIVCEDTANNCGLVGIRSDGSLYAIANNAHTESELAGVCFSPDGKIMFVNVQHPGMTLAITGPWPSA